MTDGQTLPPMCFSGWPVIQFQLGSTALLRPKEVYPPSAVHRIKHCRQLIHKLYNATVWTFSKLRSIIFANTTYFYNINIFFSSQ
jgi:hypothetical protein